MNYECPSCFLQWKDHKEPQNNIYHPLCIFCSIKHSQKELLNWQMDHIDNINKEKVFIILRHFYRFVELELKLLKEKLYEKDSDSSKLNSRES